MERKRQLGEDPAGLVAKCHSKERKRRMSKREKARCEDDESMAKVRDDARIANDE
jgi:hypothetical protein